MHANLELTRLCNQRCVYCFNDSGPDRANAGMAMDWAGAIKTLSRLQFKSVHFTGGEPFLVPGVIELMRLALRRGLKISVLSNGYDIPRVLEARSQKAVLARLQVAQISLDSLDKDIHDRRRRKTGAWAASIAAIKALTQARIPTEVSCVVDEETERGVEALATFAHSQKARLILRPRVPSGRAAGGRQYVLSDSVRDSAGRFKRVLTEDRFHYVSADRTGRQGPPGIVTVTPTGHLSGDLSAFPHGAKLDADGQLVTN